MKILLLFVALLCTITLSSGLAPSAASMSDTAPKETAVVKFSQPVQVMGATLRGQYLFVHEDGARARGEACTFVYKGVVELPKNLVVSFHCTPAARAKAASFTVRTVLTLPGQYELREFQFAGSSEAHIVMVAPHAEHVNLAPLE